DYKVTLWTPKRKNGQVVEQRWFCGAHADVGGGYDSRELSDLSLRWMQARAMRCGLAIDPALMPAVDPDSTSAPISDSFGQFLHGIYALTHNRFYRVMEITPDGNEALDDSVMARYRANDRYRPQNQGFPRG